MGFPTHTLDEVSKRRIRKLSFVELLWLCISRMVSGTISSPEPFETIPKDLSCSPALGNREVPVPLSPASVLYVGATGARFDGVISDVDRAVRATIELMRDGCNGFITLADGVEQYKLSMWAHAQLMRIVITNYEPPPHLSDKAWERVEELRAAYSRAGVVLRPYRLPAKIENDGQRRYAQIHVQRFGRLKPLALV